MTRRSMPTVILRTHAHDLDMNHRTDVIFLAGLPGTPESRPHSAVNR